MQFCHTFEMMEGQTSAHDSLKVFTGSRSIGLLVGLSSPPYQIRKYSFIATEAFDQMDYYCLHNLKEEKNLALVFLGSEFNYQLDGAYR